MPFDSNAGWIIRTGAEYLDIIRADLDARRDAQGLDSLTYDEDTFFGLITEAMAEALGSLDEGVQQVWQSRSPLSATGESLTDLAALTGIQGRLPATFSTASLSLIGDPGTLVPAGLVIRDTLAQDWVVQADVTLVSPGAGVAVVRALNPGPVEADALTITQPQTTIVGLDGVTNVNPAQPGRPIETDTQLRQRQADLVSLGGNDTVGALRASCLLVDDVQQCEVLNNRTNSIVTKFGHTMAKHSLSVFIYPTLGATQEAELADVILGFTPAGIEMNGNSTTQRPIPETDPVEYTDAGQIKWTYQAPQNVEVDVVVELAQGYSLEQVTPAIEQAVADYQTALLEERIQARKVRRLRLLGLLNNIAGIFAADVLLDNLDADVTLDIEYYPVLVIDTITEGTP